MFVKELFPADAAIRRRLLVFAKLISRFVTHIPRLVWIHGFSRSRVADLSIGTLGIVPNLIANAFAKT